MKPLFSTLLLSMLFSFDAVAALPLAVEGQALPSLAPMIERVQGSLVRISVQMRVRTRRAPFDDPFFRRFLDQGRSQKAQSFATGVVVDGDKGLILTNEHSVRGASKIKVILNDGRVVEGEVIGSDLNSDVALIKVNVIGLTPIGVANSDGMRVGDFVVSVGNPIDGKNTIVTGVISALARSNGMRPHQKFIQSDAAVGPGVLLDLNGDLVGLNIAKSVPTSNSLRIGFSTPVALALRVKEQLLKYGSPQRGFLAIRVQDLTPELARAFNIKQPGGVVITSVRPGSSAEQAGMVVGDVVLEAGVQTVRRSNDLRSIIGQQFAGDILPMTVVRRGARLRLQPLLESSSGGSSKGTMIHHHLVGATLSNVGAGEVGASVDQGVLVSEVKKGSVAWGHGVRTNDVIVSANRKSVRDVDGLRKAITGQDVLMLNVVRGNGALFLLLQ